MPRKVERLLKLGWVEVRPTFGLALPIMAGMVSQMLLGLADTIMVGRVGVIPLAAASFVNILFHIPLVFGIGMMSSVPVMASQAYGARQWSEVGETWRHGLLLSLGMGVLLALVLAATRWVLPWFGQPPEVVAASGAYLWLVSASLLPLLVTHTAKQISESVNRPWIPTWIMLGGVGLNIWLNWILIYGHWGMPALGLEGAGWATLIARLVMAAAMIWHVITAPKLSAYQPARWMAPLDHHRWRHLWRLGWPVAFQHVCEVGAFAFCGLMMGWVGAEALAAHQIALSCAAFTFMFPLGVGMAVCIRVGHAWGAGQFRRVRRIGLVGLTMAVTIMGAAAIGFMTARNPIARLFTPAPDVIALAAQLLCVAALFQVADGIQVVAISALRGLSDIRIPAVIAMVAYWVVAVPSAYVLAFPFRLEAMGIWSALAFGLGTAAVALSWRFHRRTLNRLRT